MKGGIAILNVQVMEASTRFTALIKSAAKLKNSML